MRCCKLTIMVKLITKQSTIYLVFEQFFVTNDLIIIIIVFITENLAFELVKEHAPKLSHVSKCQATAEDPCEFEGCEETKAVLRHMTFCLAKNNNCEEPLCAPYKLLLFHAVCCKSFDCSPCAAINEFDKMKNPVRGPRYYNETKHNKPKNKRSKNKKYNKNNQGETNKFSFHIIIKVCSELYIF